MRPSPQIVAEHARLDVVMHNAGHMVFGPAEAFTPEQLAELYDVNVLEHPAGQPGRLAATAQAGKGLAGLGVEQQLGRRHAAVSRAILRREGGHGRAGGESMPRELTRWGIETSIIVPGAFTGGTNHFAHSGSPADEARVAEYEAGPYAGMGETNPQRIRRDRAAGGRRVVSGRCDRRGSSICRSASGHSGSISTPRKTAPMSPSPSSTASATKCCTVSDFPTCSSRGSTAETLARGARASVPPCLAINRRAASSGSARSSRADSNG